MLRFCQLWDGGRQPPLHILRSHQWCLRLVTQGHISSKALEMFAVISYLLGIFTTHLDESSKNTATLLKITIKFLGPINYYQVVLDFFSCFACAGEKVDSDSAFVYKLVCQTTLQWLIIGMQKLFQDVFKDNQSCLWKKDR